MKVSGCVCARDDVDERVLEACALAMTLMNVWWRRVRIYLIYINSYKGLI